MRKIVFLIILIFTNGCIAERSNINSIRITDSSPNNIRIYSTDFGLGTSSTDPVKQQIAAEHCAKYGKYFFFYAYDFNSNGANFVCSKLPNRTGELLSTNYVAGSNVASSMATENRAACKEFGYKEGTEKFADCVLELTKISMSQNQQNIGNNNEISEAMREANRIERAKALLEYSKRNQSNQKNCTTIQTGTVWRTVCN